MPKMTQITILEFRCGTCDGLTVQDVLPPSIHPDTGQPYKWGGKGNWQAIPVIPAALLAIWQQEVSLRRENAGALGAHCRYQNVSMTLRASGPELWPLSVTFQPTAIMNAIAT